MVRVTVLTHRTRGTATQETFEVRSYQQLENTIIVGPGGPVPIAVQKEDPTANYLEKIFKS